MDNDKLSGNVWVTPELEQIEMVDTATFTAGCMPTGMLPGSKTMAGEENPTNNCSIGS